MVNPKARADEKGEWTCAMCGGRMHIPLVDAGGRDDLSR